MDYSEPTSNNWLHRGFALLLAIGLLVMLSPKRSGPRSKVAIKMMESTVYRMMKAKRMRIIHTTQPRTDQLHVLQQHDQPPKCKVRVTRIVPKWEKRLDDRGNEYDAYSW